MRSLVLAASAVCLLPLCGLAQWPGFRGPNGSGVGAGSGYPGELSLEKNTLWKIDMPYAQSSPVVFGDRVFLTTSAAGKLITLCVSARTGAELWRREIQPQKTTPVFRANDPASPTPAVDDKGVYVFFADFGLVAYSHDGKELWRAPLGPFENFYGMASSPIVSGGLVIQLCDQKKAAYLIALDRATGKRRWKTERPDAPIGWGTPMVYQPGQSPAELIVIGSKSIDSYYLATGERHWWRPVGSQGAMGTALALGDTVVVTTLASTEPMIPPFAAALAKFDKDKDGRISREEFRASADLYEHFGWIDDNGDGFIDAKEWELAASMDQGEYGAVALRPAATNGRLPDTAVRWRFTKNLPYIPTPIIYHDVFYMVRTGGIVTALDAATGAVLKQGRAPNALGDYYASPVAADGKLYLASEDGKLSVIKAAGKDWEGISMVDFGEEIHATPALSGGRVFVRTKSKFYCLGTRN